MKKIIQILILPIICLLIISIPRVVFAQRQIADFTYQYQKYLQMYPNYEIKRDEFLDHKTLASQNDAISITQAIMIQRAMVMKTYFLALRYKLNTGPSFDADTISKLSFKLSDADGWLQNHIEDLSKVKNPTLTQLFEISNRFEKHKLEYSSLGYQSIATIYIGKMYDLQQRIIATDSILSQYISSLDDSSYLTNWLKDSKKSSYEALLSIRRAEDIRDNKLKNGTDVQFIKQLNRINDELENSKRLLLQSSGFQKEIIGELKKNYKIDLDVNSNNIDNNEATESSNINNL